MKLRRDIRGVTAWILLLVFIQFFAVKSMHYHHDDECSQSSQQQHKHHSCSDCPICHFTLSSFTEAENIEINFFAEYYPAPISFYNDIKTSRTLCHHYLRAPPVA